MTKSEQDKLALIEILKKIDEMPQAKTKPPLNAEQCKQLARSIKKLLKQQLH